MNRLSSQHKAGRICRLRVIRLSVSLILLGAIAPQAVCALPLPVAIQLPSTEMRESSEVPAVPPLIPPIIHGDFWNPIDQGAGEGEPPDEEARPTPTVTVTGTRSPDPTSTQTPVVTIAPFPTQCFESSGFYNFQPGETWYLSVARTNCLPEKLKGCADPAFNGSCHIVRNHPAQYGLGGIEAGLSCQKQPLFGPLGAGGGKPGLVRDDGD